MSCSLYQLTEDKLGLGANGSHMYTVFKCIFDFGLSWALNLT